jgi:GntR family transcriptional regulator / MocR family aminotransferase
LDVPTVPIGVDERGAKVAELDGLNASAALLTPAHHSPLGMPLHAPRRTEVI